MSEYPRPPRDDAEREACATSWGDWCGAPYAPTGHVCTRTRGHRGSHIAAFTDFVGTNWIAGMWPAAPEASTPETLTARMAEALRVMVAQSGFALDDVRAHESALADFFSTQSPEHEDGCPEDDTCDCADIRALHAAGPPMRRSMTRLFDATRTARALLAEYDAASPAPVATPAPEVKALVAEAHWQRTVDLFAPALAMMARCEHDGEGPCEECIRKMLAMARQRALAAACGSKE